MTTTMEQMVIQLQQELFTLKAQVVARVQMAAAGCQQASGSLNIYNGKTFLEHQAWMLTRWSLSVAPSRKCLFGFMGKKKDVVAEIPSRAIQTFGRRAGHVERPLSQRQRPRNARHQWTSSFCGNSNVGCFEGRSSYVVRNHNLSLQFGIRKVGLERQFTF